MRKYILNSNSTRQIKDKKIKIKWKLVLTNVRKSTEIQTNVYLRNIEQRSKSEKNKKRGTLSCEIF